MYLISKLLMNGLFGKTGQDYRFNECILVNNDTLLQLIQNENIEVISVTEIGTDLNFVIYFYKEKFSNNSATPHSFNGCIAHASEITSAARVEMSLVIKYLIDNKYTIYYMDTDSFFIDKPLPDHLVSPTELGKYKLEHIYKEALFLAPKVYAGITQDGEEIIQIKGLTKDTINKDVTYELLKTLLVKDSSLLFNQTKTFKNIGLSTIRLLEQTYKLIPTENKRELIYDNNLLVKTNTFVIDQDKVIKTHY